MELNKIIVLKYCSCIVVWMQHIQVASEEWSMMQLPPKPICKMLLMTARIHIFAYLLFETLKSGKNFGLIMVYPTCDGERYC